MKRIHIDLLIAGTIPVTGMITVTDPDNVDSKKEKPEIVNHVEKPVAPTGNGFNWSTKQYNILHYSYGFSEEEISLIKKDDAMILIGNESQRYNREGTKLKREKPTLNGKGEVFPPPVAEYGKPKRGRPPGRANTSR